MSGLDYLRALFYDPNLARFVSQDTFAGIPTSPLTLNHFIYGNQDPVNRSDPSGHLSLLEVQIGLAIFNFTIALMINLQIKGLTFGAVAGAVMTGLLGLVMPALPLGIQLLVFVVGAGYTYNLFNDPNVPDSAKFLMVIGLLVNVTAGIGAKLGLFDGPGLNSGPGGGSTVVKGDTSGTKITPPGATPVPAGGGSNPAPQAPTPLEGTHPELAQLLGRIRIQMQGLSAEEIEAALTQAIAQFRAQTGQKTGGNGAFVVNKGNRTSGFGGIHGGSVGGITQLGPKRD